MSYQSLEDEDVRSDEDDELEGLQRETSAPATYVPSSSLALTVHSRRYLLLSFHTGATSFVTAICSLDIFTFCIMRSPKYRSQPLGTRSLYALSKSEVTKNIANRFVHSRSYVILYLAMASLSTTTVILSLQDGCPGFAFYILEIIINVAMIAEVSIRFIAFGKQFWKSPYNVVDLGLTFLCVLTLLVILFAGCGATSKEEELLDTLLLVARNVLQFGRLATVMRRSGRSIFSRPRAIDLSTTRTSRLDIDLDDEEARIGVGIDNDVEFDASTEFETQRPRQGVERGAVRVHQSEEDEADVWARLG